MTKSALNYDSFRPIKQLLPLFEKQYQHILEDSCGSAVAAVMGNNGVKCIFFLADNNREWVHIIECDPSLFRVDPDDPSNVCGAGMLDLLGSDPQVLEFLRPRENRKDDPVILEHIDEFKDLVLARSEEMNTEFAEYQQKMGIFIEAINQMVSMIRPYAEDAFEIDFSASTDIKLGQDDKGNLVVALIFSPAPPDEELSNELFGNSVGDAGDEDGDVLDESDLPNQDLGELPSDFLSDINSIDDWQSLFKGSEKNE